MRDRDGRRNAGDPFGGGLFEPFEELPRVGRESFDVPPLAFGIQRVEGQAGLAAAAQPADDDQLPMGNIEIDPFEVVNLDPAEHDRPVRRKHGDRRLAARAILPLDRELLGASPHLFIIAHVVATQENDLEAKSLS